MEQLKVIITGATGYVGEGVLLECLANPQVKEVLIVNRKPYDLKHPKLKQCLVADFMQLDAVKTQLSGYDACFYCAGISSVGLDEKAFTHITYDVTMNFATVLSELNPNMVFTFVTGAGTDSSEQGKVMWARVKGRTENALMRLPFRNAFNFRPAIMKTVRGQKNVKPLFKILVPLFSVLLPGKTCTLKDVAQAMINATTVGYPKPILEVKDIKELAKANSV